MPAINLVPNRIDACAVVRLEESRLDTERLREVARFAREGVQLAEGVGEVEQINR